MSLLSRKFSQWKVYFTLWCCNASFVGIDISLQRVYRSLILTFPFEMQLASCCEFWYYSFKKNNMHKILTMHSFSAVDFWGIGKISQLWNCNFTVYIQFPITCILCLVVGRESYGWGIQIRKIMCLPVAHGSQSEEIKFLMTKCSPVKYFIKEKEN